FSAGQCRLSFGTFNGFSRLYGSFAGIPSGNSSSTRARACSQPDPANAYNGQTGLLPNSISCEKPYTGKIRFNLSQDAPHVEDINNCHIVCLMIDANTGRVINAASAKVQNGTSAIESTTDANGRIQVKGTKGGILVDAKEDVRVTLFDAAGRMLHQANGKGRLWLPTSHQGVIVVKCETADAVSTQKVVL
ncbi:MAG: hypothetical protein II199_07530, partial [Bacteroidaceae bacterium]|nr:hypothetical protein [Bacteroidaceae bacterium]